MYGVVLNKQLGVKAVEIQKQLETKGIQTRSFFFPMHLQPVFQMMPWYTKEKLVVSEELFDYGFYLPSGLTLTEENAAEVVSALKEILNGI
jgi:perosamine synthetase